VPTVRILDSSLLETDRERRKRWGDSHVGRNLARSFVKAGYLETRGVPDVLVQSWGQPQPVPPARCRILWVSSHPEWLTARVLNAFDRVFCQSRTVTEMLRAKGFDVEYLFGATAVQPQADPTPVYDVVFVGNPKGESRWCVDALGDGFDLAVWGERWGHLGAAWKGLYFDNERIGRLYADARVVINDHHPTMRQYGFVNGRVLDALAAGGFCVSDGNEAVREVLGDAVPMADDSTQFRMLVRHFVEHPEARAEFIREGQAIALGYSYDAAVARMVEGL
jgi:hypothetical protein